MKRILKWAQLILLHFGLVGLCIVYILSGATVFYLLERPAEDAQREAGLRRLAESKAVLVEELWELQQGERDVEAGKAATRLALDRHFRVLFESQQNVYIAVGLDPAGNPREQFESVWTPESAILLALTTVTTVGYGFVTPKTPMGQLFTVGFGLLGIPLTLVTIADLARFLGLGVVTGLVKMSRGIRYFCAFVTRDPSKKPRKKAEGEDLDEDEAGVPMSVTLLILISYPVLGAAYFLHCNASWAFLDSFYFALMSILTVTFKYPIVNIGYCVILFGLSLLCFLVEEGVEVVKAAAKNECASLGVCARESWGMCARVFLI